MAVAASPGPAHAQTPYVPYFGKNQIRYDNFKWMTYETDHFVIYFYPEIQPHLERMAGYAESAYQHISTELKYDLGPEKVRAHPVPDQQRVPAAERDSRARRRKASAPSPSRRASGS